MLNRIIIGLVTLASFIAGWSIILMLGANQNEDPNPEQSENKHKPLVQRSSNEIISEFEDNMRKASEQLDILEQHYEELSDRLSRLSDRTFKLQKQENQALFSEQDEIENDNLLYRSYKQGIEYEQPNDNEQMKVKLEMLMFSQQRDDAWANNMEETLRDVFHADPADRVSIVDSTCQQTLCRLRLDFEKENVKEVLDKQILSNPALVKSEIFINRVSDGTTGAARLEVYLAREGHHLPVLYAQER
jgi:truncated hemoglobin YjbI